MYPMIPHILLPFTFYLLPFAFYLLPFAFCLLPFLNPAFDVALLARADRKRSGRHVLSNRRPAPDVCALADGDGRDQLRVGADERAVLDGRHVLPFAVVVARDRA